MAAGPPPAEALAAGARPTLADKAGGFEEPGTAVDEVAAVDAAFADGGRVPVDSAVAVGVTGLGVVGLRVA